MNLLQPQEPHVFISRGVSQVGLAVGDIESVQRYAYLRNKGKFVDFVYGVERRFPKFITRYFYKPQLVISGSFLEKKISSQYVQYHNDNSFQKKTCIEGYLLIHLSLFSVIYGKLQSLKKFRTFENKERDFYFVRKEVKKYILTIIQSIGARVYIHFEVLFS